MRLRTTGLHVSTTTMLRFLLLTFPLSIGRRIRIAFRVVGNVCCIDPACLTGADYSSVRHVLTLDDRREVPATLLVRNFDDGLATLARLRVIRCWDCPANEPAPEHHVFAPDGVLFPPHRGATAGAGWVVGPSRRLFAGSEDMVCTPQSTPRTTPSLPFDTHKSAPVSICAAADRFLAHGTDALPCLVHHPHHSALQASEMESLSAQLEPELPPLTQDVVVEEDEVEGVAVVEDPAPLLQDILSECGDHELTRRKRRVRRKRAVDGASKRRHNKRLAAKERPQYEDTVAKAARVKATKFDMTGISSSLAAALADSGVLDRPPPSSIPKKALRRLGVACRVQRLEELDEAVQRVSK